MRLPLAFCLFLFSVPAPPSGLQRYADDVSCIKLIYHIKCWCIIQKADLHNSLRCLFNWDDYRALPGDHPAGPVFSFCSFELQPGFDQILVIMWEERQIPSSFLKKVDLIFSTTSDIPQLMLLLLRESARAQKVLLPGLVSITIWLNRRTICVKVKIGKRKCESESWKVKVWKLKLESEVGK